MAYNGISPYLYKNSISTVDIFDDISGSFNGVTTTFNITVGGASYTRLTAKACLIVLGGIVQEAGVDYTINGGQITFTTAPVSGLTFEGRHLFGLNGVDTPTSGSVYPSTLSTGGPSWDTSGNVTVSGNLTVNGSTTTINSTTLSIDDKNIVIADGQSTSAGIDTSGIDFGTSSVRLRYYHNAGTNSGLNIEGTRVGIGTTSVTEQLTLYGSTASTLGVSITPLGWNSARHRFTVPTEGKTSIISWNYNGSSLDSSLYATSAISVADGYISLSTGAVNSAPQERLFVASSGNVGIGTNNPQTRLDVFVNGGEGLPAVIFGERMRIISNDLNSRSAYLNIIAGTSAYSGLLFGDATSAEPGKIRYYHADNSLQFYTNGANNERVRIDGSGNVGIGTTNPLSKLNVLGTQGNWRVDTDTVSNEIQVLTSVPDNTGFRDYRVRTNQIIFDTNGSEKFRINTSGNVGIGTTNPGTSLHIFGSNGNTGEIRLQSSDGRVYAVGSTGSGYGSSNNFIIYDITGTAERLRITSSGNIGIGINPSFKLDVNGSIRAYSSTVGTLPYLFLNYDVTPVNGAAHGRIAVSKSDQNSYSGKIHLQPQYFDGSNYNYLPNGLVVDATGYVGVGVPGAIAPLEVNPGANGFRPIMGTNCQLVGTLDSGPGYTMFTVRAAGDGNLRNLILQFNRTGSCPGIYVEYSGSSGYQPDHGNFGNAYIQFACAGGTTLYSGTNQLAAFAGKTVSWSHSNGTTPVQLIISSAIQTEYAFYHFKCFHGRGYIGSIQVLTS